MAMISFRNGVRITKRYRASDKPRKPRNGHQSVDPRDARVFDFKTKGGKKKKKRKNRPPSNRIENKSPETIGDMPVIFFRGPIFVALA